jgi:hypothetical protein
MYEENYKMDAVSERRQERLKLIAMIKNSIRTAEVVNKEKLIATVCLEIGCARRRIVEIIKMIIVSEFAEEQGEDLCIIKPPMQQSVVE